MIRRSPCECYIKYLLVHPDGYADTAVIDLLRLQQLDVVSAAYIDRLRRSMRLPKPFYPSNRLHRPSSRFLRAQHIYLLFHPDQSMREAQQILRHARGKELMETLVLAGEPPAFIAHRLSGAGFKCTTETVERYCHHFWNLRLLDSTETRALLRLRWEYVSDVEEPEDARTRTALKKAYHNDPRRIVAENPVSPLAGVMGQMQLGYMPGQVELSRLADATRTAAQLQMMASSVVGGPGRAAEARDWSMVVSAMTQLIADIGSPEAELQKELQQLGLKTEEAMVPHIKELSDGSHTVDLQPIGDSDVSEEPRAGASGGTGGSAG